MRADRIGVQWLCAVVLIGGMSAQPARAQLQSYETEFLKLVYYNPNHAYLVPHLARCFENSLRFHRKLFDYTPSEKIVILLHDFGDYGHGGTSTVPWNYVTIGISPFDYVYETMPANERMNWLMHHELVHVVATDKDADSDLLFRRLFHGKVAPTPENPLSMLYSYLASPRWYSPRWYHEGIAVFLETWMAGGLGRVLGGYDEMVFRAMVIEESHFYDVVGLESEGTTIDFQVGQNSYLYGTRFTSYLALQYGPEKLIRWFDRSAGSHRYFSSQFRQIYGIGLDQAWAEWVSWEKQWQRENLKRIREFPVTPATPLSDQILGSVSRAFADLESRKLYVAANYPGSGAHIASIDLDTGSLKRLTDIASPALYYVTSLAYDPDSQSLFFTTDNTRGWRDLNRLDLRTGRKTQLQKDLRTGDLVVNRADQSLWGVRHHDGLSSLIRLPPPYEEWEPVLVLDYGRDIFDLDISPDGRLLSASMIEVSGRQRLILLEIDQLLAGRSDFQVLHEFEDNGPANFVFSPDGNYLYGTSYYTGVSNIWRYDLERQVMEVVSNAETGFFRPLPLENGELIAFRYVSEGFQPVSVPIEVREDLNAIHYLGQQVVERHPVLDTWNAGSPRTVDLDQALTHSGEYKPLKSIRPASIYPVVEGYQDSVAAGVRVNFADPVGLHNMNLTATFSPDGALETDERFHLNFEYDRWPWKFRAAYNGTDFYDLFGPTKTSRKGLAAGFTYGNLLIDERPRTLEYRFHLTGYSGLDRLPDYQNVTAPFDKLLSGGASLHYRHTRRTIGAVEPEKGVEWRLAFHNNLVNSKLFPRFFGDASYGFLLPWDHSSIWLRGSAGQSFGDRDDPFANFFFGGFGNNWVDYQEVRRYREYYAFPGTELNEIGGKNFAKATVEWTLPPLRFQRVGVPAFYANWAHLSLFTSGLITNLDRAEERRSLINAGAQLDIKLVLFSSLESTFSVGFAGAFGKDRAPSSELMLSLKLLR